MTARTKAWLVIGLMIMGMIVALPIFLNTLTLPSASPGNVLQLILGGSPIWLAIGILIPWILKKDSEEWLLGVLWTLMELAFLSLIMIFILTDPATIATHAWLMTAPGSLIFLFWSVLITMWVAKIRKLKTK